MVVFGQCVCIRTKVVVFGKLVVFRHNWLNSGKMVVFRQKWLYSGSSRIEELFPGFSISPKNQR